MENKIRPIKEILQQEISDRSISAAKRLLPSVRPIYGANDRDGFELIGSGVIIKVDNYYFFVTAGHVLDKLQGSGIYVRGEKTVINITGKLTRAAMNGVSRDKDKIDFAYLELSDNSLNELGRNNIITPEDIDPNDIAKREKQYMILGYPISKNKWADYKALKMKLDPYIYSSRPANINIYKELCLSETLHLLLDFDKDKVTNSTGNVFTAPDLYGMSGGGIWMLHDDSMGALSIFSDLQSSKLVGIIIEWDLRKKVIIAVRISCVIAAILKEYPNLKDKLPMPSRVKVNIS